MTDDLDHPSIARSFRELTDADVADIEEAFSFGKAFTSQKLGWGELLGSKRILLVSEAGTGKTHECRSQRDLLWKAGEPAFFLELATLASGSVREQLDGNEEERLDTWLASPSLIATFFLDSIDELKLTLGKFDQALKRLAKEVNGQLGRARIVITTRPIAVDRQLIERHLPYPEPKQAEPTAEAFADRVVNRPKADASETAVEPKIWRNVRLLPLTHDEMRAMAITQCVTNPDALLADINERDATEFAERPQDLIELCADWRVNNRIRSHHDQVDSNIRVKLTPAIDRKEAAEVSLEKAIEGATRLALACLLTRRMTLRYSAASDCVQASEAALDVPTVLYDWTSDERTALLQRPLFGFASYGRVRFHHRSVVEFLAARRLHKLIESGVAIKSIKRLLFAETGQGLRVVRPSMRPVAAWLSIDHDTIFDEVNVRDPGTLLDFGDPQSLPPPSRIRALEAFVDRHGTGGWRGLRIPQIQVRRFVSAELEDIVICLWNKGIENPEIRELLLQLIAAGKFQKCADIAHIVVMDSNAPIYERLLALEALFKLQDPRIADISTSLEKDPAKWPGRVAARVMLRLFPHHLTIGRLTQILRRIRERSSGNGDLHHRLPEEIAEANLSPVYLDQLRCALTNLVSEGLTWDLNKHPHLRTPRPDLLVSLLAACRRQADDGIKTAPWIDSSLLVLTLNRGDRFDNESLSALRQVLAMLPVDARENAFWRHHDRIAAIHQIEDLWHRIHYLGAENGLKLDGELDATWVRTRLSDPNGPLDHREMMLWVELILMRPDTDPHERLLALRNIVADAPRLTAIVDRYLNPPPASETVRRMEARIARDHKNTANKALKIHASWVEFWREIVANPEGVFSHERAHNTAWHLWQAMARSGEESRASGWNRAYIEQQFGRSVADKLRSTMMQLWRQDRPSLQSERPAEKKGVFLVRWQFGLAGIFAEAEAPEWAKQLTSAEAELACRYAPLEFNGFPTWLEGLAAQHPTSVDDVLGHELTASLQETVSQNTYSMLLQDVSYATGDLAALFVPRIRNWLFSIVQIANISAGQELKRSLAQAVTILLTHGNPADRASIKSIAEGQLLNGVDVPLSDIWLPALFNLNPTAAVDAVEKTLQTFRAGEGVGLFARMFNRDEREVAVDLKAPSFTPALLLRFLRLAYKAVMRDDDVPHEGTYTPDVRDRAERNRNSILDAVLSTTGPEGWAVKLELASDPLFAHLRSRVLLLATEGAAEEVDNLTLTEREFTLVDKTGEAPPSTREAMFALMRDRLDDIEDLLLQDASPRQLWSTIKDEHVMRRELARELKNLANGNYTVDQEAVTADEKETDIRLRSTDGRSKQQGVIELKLGDHRPGTDLFDTIKNQLLTKYMAAEECRAGCLLVTISKHRNWDHPQSGVSLTFEQLIDVLNMEAERLSQELGGAAKLMARGLDLRPRLKNER